MRYTITGDNLQFVNVQLEEKETLQSVAGGMAYMTGNMVMEAKMEGGILRGLGRTISGASLFLVEYRSKGGTGIVGLAGSAPGKVVDLDVGRGKWIVQKTGYLGSQATVNLKLAFQKKLGNVFFGGEGFVLQELSGSGIAFIAACGDFNIVDLKQGEQYKVATAKAVAWQESVKYDIAAAGGIKTAVFGGEGLFVTTLTGPGKIIIQSMTLAELAHSLMPYIPLNK